MWTGKATPINISFRNLGLLCWIKFRLSKDDLGLTWFLPVPLPMGQFALYCYDYHILYSLSVFGSSALQFQDHTSVILWQAQQRLVKNHWFSLRSVPAPHEHVQPFPSLLANICIRWLKWIFVHELYAKHFPVWFGQTDKYANIIRITALVLGQGRQMALQDHHHEEMTGQLELKNTEAMTHLCPEDATVTCELHYCSNFNS